MRRQNDSDKYELSDAEKRDLIKLINEGKPLPEKYRFLLFEDNAKSNWSGTARPVKSARPSCHFKPWNTSTNRAKKQANKTNQSCSTRAAVNSKAGPTSSSGATTS
jgi:hypothetical protein